jgi:opacity protein-like surface antigen
MLLPRLFLGALLLGSPLLGRAQATEPAPSPRYYVGLAAYNSYYQGFGSKAYGNGNGSLRLPVQLTAGYQVRPRLALQVGVAYSTARYSYDNEFIYYSKTGSLPLYSRYQGSVRLRATSVSLLSRYTLTRNLAHRVQFDALAGFGLEHDRGYIRRTQSDSIAGRLQTTSYSGRGSQNFFLLTLGAGVRYRLTQHLELNLDVMANHTVPFFSPASRIDEITSSAALGLRYRFGTR